MYIEQGAVAAQRIAAGTGGAGSAKSAALSSNGPSDSGILAMVASEKKRRRTSCHSCCYSCNWLPTSRTIAASLGKMPTTLVWRLITALPSAPIGATFSRSSGLVLQILSQCSCGKWRNASTSSRAASITGTAPRNCSRSISVTFCQCDAKSSPGIST